MWKVLSEVRDFSKVERFGYFYILEYYVVLKIFKSIEGYV